MIPWYTGVDPSREEAGQNLQTANKNILQIPDLLDDEKLDGDVCLLDQTFFCRPWTPYL